MTDYVVGSLDTYPNFGDAVTGILGDLSGGDLATGGGGVRRILLAKETFLGNALISAGAFNNATDDVNYIEVRAKAGDQHGGIYEAGPILDNNGVGDTLSVSVPGTKVFDIQCTESGATFREPIVASGAGNRRFERVLIKGNGVDSGNGLQLTNTGVGTVVCCWSKDCGNGYSAQSGTHTIYNSGASNHSSRGFTRAGNVMICINCVGFDNVTADYNAITVAGSTNNISEDPSAPGTDPLINQLVANMKFVNEGTDFHILQDSILQLAGVNQDTIFTTDINGNIIKLGKWMAGYHYLAKPVVSGGDDVFNSPSESVFNRAA